MLTSRIRSSLFGTVLTVGLGAVLLTGCGGGGGGAQTASAPSALSGDVSFKVVDPSTAIVSWNTVAPTSGAKVLFAAKDKVTGNFLFDPATAQAESGSAATAHSITVTNAVIGGASFAPGEQSVRIHLSGQNLPNEDGVLASN